MPAMAFTKSTSRDMRIKWWPLIPGVICVSWAAVFIRASSAPAIAIAAYRMIFAWLLLIPPAIFIYRRQFSEFDKSNLILAALAGTLLGWHFFFWVNSLKHTTIAASVVLVTTQPVFVALFSKLILKEKIGIRGTTAIIMAMIGSAIIAGFDLGLEKRYILGDMLALAGAVMAGAYLFIGRIVRARVSTAPYITVVYGVSAITLAIILAASGDLLKVYDVREYGLFLLLAVVPTILGHSLYNYALKHVAAHKVGLSIVGEPVLATVWGIIIFSEIPRLTTVAGGIIIICALLLAFSREGD